MRFLARSVALVLALAWAPVACRDGSARDVGGDAARPDAGALDGSAQDGSGLDAGAGLEDSGLDAGAVAAEDASTPMPRFVQRYLALGSSSTAGSGASTPEHAYVELLAQHFRETNSALVLDNLGSGGATIDNFLGAREHIARFAPDLVTLLPFTDVVRTAPDRYRQGYAELLDLLGAAGATVFFGDPRLDPDLVCGTGSGPGGCYGAEDRDLLAAKNEIVAELAATRSFVVVVPVFDQNVAHPEWNAPDGHPNDLGHAYLAETFRAAIDP